VRRIWGLTDDFIADKHLLNIHAVKRRDDDFRLLDLGCGTGDLIARLAPQFPRAEFVGLDSNGPSIARALSRCTLRSTFNCSTFENVRGIFDIVVCSEVIEHVSESDQLLDALRDHVAFGGHLSISTPSGWMFRTPRLYNVYKFLQSPRRFVRLYLRPEEHWQEAVTIHRRCCHRSSDGESKSAVSH
jgi:2-polyprenyl-3-methyl-5-hydroxy-6-metoxy-1,4-benzoquinol methylase